MNDEETCLRRELELLKKKERLYDTFYHNDGLKGIVIAAHTILENPIGVCDPSLTVIESCAVTDEEKVFENKGGKVVVKPSVFQGMRNDRFLDAIYSSSRAFYFQSPYIDTKLIVASVKINRSIVGYIAVSERNRQFTDDDLEIVNTVGKIVSAEFQKSEFFGMPRKLRYDYLIAELLDGRISDEEYFTARLQLLGRTLRPNLWIMVVSGESALLTMEQNDHTFQNLLELFPSDPVSVYRGHTVILISSKEQRPYSDEFGYRLENFLKFHQLVATVSFRCNQLLNLPEYYSQAYNTMIHVQRRAAKNAITYYDDCVLESILVHCDNHRFLQTAIHPDIRLLERFDKETNSELLMTLRTYLECDRNAARTAEMLHIHKSTFFYRISKISSMTGMNLSNCDTMFSYEISFRILDFLERS